MKYIFLYTVLNICVIIYKDKCVDVTLHYFTFVAKPIKFSSISQLNTKPQNCKGICIKRPFFKKPLWMGTVLDDYI
jgi:hypothetical protein